jgi:hypothetical protein
MNVSKEGGLHYKGGTYILVFIRNGANVAHFFRKEKNSKILTVRLVI